MIAVFMVVLPSIGRNMQTWSIDHKMFFKYLMVVTSQSLVLVIFDKKLNQNTESSWKNVISYLFWGQFGILVPVGKA